jgi:hypothetical protein
MPNHDNASVAESIRYLDVLVVCSAPVNVRPSLNLAEELGHLEDEVRRSPVPIRLRRVFPPTLEQLERELSPNALRLRQPRVVHFLGHGEEDGLWFETEEGAGERVPASRLRRLFRDTPVGLVLLNACWSATGRVLSLCDHLVREGVVEAAIGHGQPVEDKSAIAFARRFYTHLTQGLTVGEACNRAANYLAEQGLPGSQEIELRGNRDLRPGAGLEPGERSGRVEDGSRRAGSCPGPASFAGATTSTVGSRAPWPTAGNAPSASGAWAALARRAWPWRWRGVTPGAMPMVASSGWTSAT